MESYHEPIHVFCPWAALLGRPFAIKQFYFSAIVCNLLNHFLKIKYWQTMKPQIWL